MKHWILAAVLGCAALGSAGPAWAAPEWTRAVVVQVDPARSRITLKHERIASIDMDAMTMPFEVAANVKLVRLKKGDKVRFTVAGQGDRLLVDALERAR